MDRLRAAAAIAPFFLAFIVALGAASTSLADDPAAPAAPAAAAPAASPQSDDDDSNDCHGGIDDHDQLAACVEELVSDYIRGDDNSPAVAGVAVAIVKDGAPILLKGYGYSDLKARTPVSAKTTLFHIGSISKLFTATAVMQLVQRGRLNLDADVNGYLGDGLKIPATYPEPVTLKNLLTHTGGFEENQLGYMVKHDVKDLVPLEQLLKQHMPARVYPPTVNFNDGRHAAYSTWGVGLAGDIVARISGQSFDDYIDKNVLSLLHMNHSTFREPIPPDLGASLSLGYLPDSAGNLQLQGAEYFHSIGPAGSGSSTAEDMAKFMIAHLSHGAQPGIQSMLSVPTADFMHSLVLSPDPSVNGAALGFWEMHINGHRVLTHAGGTSSFITDLLLIPDENVGIFIALNTHVGSSSINGFVKQFFDHYFPGGDAPQPALAGDLSRYLGSYVATSHSYTKNEKALVLTNPDYITNVSLTSRGTLLISNIYGNNDWRQVEPGVFHQNGTQQLVAFVDDDAGNVSHMLGPMAFAAYYKLHWFQIPRVHQILIKIVLVMCLVTLLWSLVDLCIAQPQGGGARSSLRVLALQSIAIIAGVLAIRATFSQGGLALLYAYPTKMYWGLGLVLFAALLEPVVAYFAIRSFAKQHWAPLGRATYTAAVLLNAAFIWSMNYWNLLGFKFA